MRVLKSYQTKNEDMYHQSVRFQTSKTNEYKSQGTKTKIIKQQVKQMKKGLNLTENGK